MKIRVGSRESKLAVIQSQLVMDAIHTYHPEIELELITMKTTGDIILDKTLDKIGGKGLFVKELDRALLEHKVDITVHSLKDMPMEISPELPLVAFSARETPFDVLILPKGCTMLDPTKPIGCSSARRSVQLANLYPGVAVKPVRGNVLTRLEKLDGGEYSALVLAYAGIKRLGLENRISRVFSANEMIPAACQGIIAVQARAGFDCSFLKEYNDQAAQYIATAERAFVKTLDGGCSSPIACYGTLTTENTICLTGLYLDENSGIPMKIQTAYAPVTQAEPLGQKLAKQIKEHLDER